MIILDQVEKLINEHGSTPILRDNLALLRDQIAGLIRDKSALREENDKLGAKIIRLKSKIKKLASKNAVLKNEFSASIAQKKLLEAEIQNMKLEIRNQEQSHGVHRPTKQEIHYDIFHKG